MEKTESDKLFKDLYLQNYPELERYCRAMTPYLESAKELISETVAITYENFGKLKDKSKFKAYMFGISSNLFKKWLRDRKITLDISDVNGNKLSNNNDEKSELKLLYHAIGKLKEPQSEIISLFELSGFTVQEIADLKKMPVN
ncbi:MAG: sigma-70 family RNA polymerase sigma factor, partial [Bacteroidia bacterium]|nr:sigma-70 family RNA polymerase sigma factor [Bacteroidia bacterium]